MVLRIGYIKVARGIEGDAPGITELARFSAGSTDDLNRAIVGIKYLNATVSEFADILATGAVDANIIRIAQFAQAGASFSIHAKEFALTREDLDAMIAGIGDVKSVL